MSPGFWRDRSVLVTGASGLLGGWLVKELVERGSLVTALVRDSEPRSMLAREGWIHRIVVVRGSVEDAPLLRRTMAEYQIRTVFHLAAQTQVGVAKADPVSTLEANVRGTWTVLEAARLGEVGEVVVASSDKAYGASEELPYVETHPMQGQYPYDVSKSCADLISTMYAATYGLRTGITRCGNLFGGGDLNFGRTVPGLVKATLDNEPFVIRSDGTFVRDFLYVKDAVLAYMTLAEHLSTDESLAGAAFNFSLEERLTVLDIVERVLTMMDRRDLEPVIQNRATAEIREQYMSAAKARQVLGWSPRYGLDRGLQETIEWYRAFFEQRGGTGDVEAGGTASVATA